MKPLDERTLANLDVALEAACRDLPHGGDHDFRKKVALKLMGAARKGETSLTALSAVAREAISEMKAKKAG